MSYTHSILKKVKDNITYTAAFTSASLLHTEHLVMESLLCTNNFSELIAAEIKNNAFLKVKTQAGRKRITQELIKRNASATEGFWDFFFSISEQEQKLGLFFLCLKTYKLLMDFHLEVVLKKWKTKSLHLDVVDLQMRLDEIASEYEDVSAWSEVTQRKTITVYKRMLTEAGLLKKKELIRPAGITSLFWDYFIEKGEGWFIEACFHNRHQI